MFFPDLTYTILVLLVVTVLLGSLKLLLNCSYISFQFFRLAQKNRPTVELLD